MATLNYNSILDNITEGYPVTLTRTNGIVCSVSMERVNGEEVYKATVAGITICTNDYDSLFTTLSNYKYKAIKY